MTEAKPSGSNISSGKRIITVFGSSRPAEGNTDYEEARLAVRSPKADSRYAAEVMAG
jgi:hypothetical protein